jgi:hypothetical protein
MCAFLLKLFLASVALGALACSGDSESSSGTTGSPVLKDYVRNPLNKAEDISEDLESRNKQLDEQINETQEDEN